MTQGEYIKTHPEQFKDEIDKWLFTEFGIIGGCCSAEKSHEYAIARMVAENITDAFIEKACEWIKENITNNPNANSVLVRNGCVTLVMLVEDFKKYMER